MKFKKNKVFRNKTVRGAKLEDLYFLMGILKLSNLSVIETIEILQGFIETEFGYEWLSENEK